MKATTRFTRAWFAWRRLSPPIERFRTGQRNSPVYDLECALDHWRSSVSSLGEGYLANREVDFAGLAPKRMGEAERIGSLVASADISEAEKTVYREYLTATCEVLEALRGA